jgi:hypothetical protein
MGNALRVMESGTKFSDRPVGNRSCFARYHAQGVAHAVKRPTLDFTLGPEDMRAASCYVPRV